MFNLKVNFQRNNHIVFDPVPHTYTFKDKTLFTSCTTLLKDLFPAFDSRSTAVKCVNGAKYKKMLQDQPNLSEEDKVAFIQNKWMELGKEAREKGTALHECIERYLNDESVPNDPVMDTAEFQQFLAFHRSMLDRGYRPLNSETIVYDEHYQICGTIDQLYIKNGQVTIVDWKRTKGISTYAFDNVKGFMPVPHLKNANYYKYALQLNLYKFILEKNYNLDVNQMLLVGFYPTKKQYEEFEVQNFQKEMQFILAQHVHSPYDHISNHEHDVL